MLPSLRAAGSKPTGTILMESICQGDLRRPLQLRELLLPTILQWTDYPEDYRKNIKFVYGNHPVIDKLFLNDKVTGKNYPRQLHRGDTKVDVYLQSVTTKSMFKIHYSSQKNKGFQQCLFGFCQTKFTLLKDSKVYIILQVEYIS